MVAWVYILKCSDGSYYTGLTHESLERRVGEHNAGTYGGYTLTRRPVRLVFSSEFDRISDAIAAERRIKRWSRAKKEALIRSDFAALRDHARRRSKEYAEASASWFETALTRLLTMRGDVVAYACPLKTRSPPAP
jgi:putative endonuclease